MNSLEFVLLTNEENHCLYRPPGWPSAASGIHLKGKSVTWCLLTWLRKTWVCRDSVPLLARGWLCNGRRWLRKIRLVWGYLHWPFESLWRRQCLETFVALSGKVNAEGHVTSPALYSLLPPPFGELHKWSISGLCIVDLPRQQVLNTSAYKMWESSVKRIN